MRICQRLYLNLIVITSIASAGYADHRHESDIELLKDDLAEFDFLKKSITNEHHFSKRFQSNEEDGQHLKGHHRSHGERNDVKHEKNVSYDFSYHVRDEDSGLSFGHDESREGKKTVGEYRVKLPDGRLQIVSYIADEGGYRANVTYEPFETENLKLTQKVDNFAERKKYTHSNNDGSSTDLTLNDPGSPIHIDKELDGKNGYMEEFTGDQSSYSSYSDNFDIDTKVDGEENENVEIKSSMSTKENSSPNPERNFDTNAKKRSSYVDEVKPYFSPSLPKNIFHQQFEESEPKSDEYISSSREDSSDYFEIKENNPSHVSAFNVQPHKKDISFGFLIKNETADEVHPPLDIKPLNALFKSDAVKPIEVTEENILPASGKLLDSTEETSFSSEEDIFKSIPSPKENNHRFHTHQLYIPYLQRNFRRSFPKRFHKRYPFGLNIVPRYGPFEALPVVYPHFRTRSELSAEEVASSIEGDS